ncbi:tetratricopeptide repeat protein [Agrobacterium sp. a22-2]|uniref:tetratricopeptide repeat-containing sulfotransferase family protein n=1 Tax=Agrobacterium sp. a22-2 TaxID=2283840 RepID=UPI001447C4DA|nr:sulfotransferase family protein [Agrobacterium sp. a22-2]NKN35793.1 tetratricopeptide repeat protein [Agrobacterium sp. a22-2]
MLSQHSPTNLEPLAESDAASRHEQAKTLKSLAALSRQQGNLEQAARQLLAAATFAPDDAEAFFDLAITLYQSGRLELALTAIKQAAALAPDHSAVLANLGRILLDLGQDAEAEVALRRGLALAPGEPPILRSLATLLRDSGRIEEAIDLWGRLVAVRPADAEAWYNLSGAVSFTPTAEDLDRLEALFRGTTNGADKTMLGFALFRAEEVRSNAQAAFAWLDAANRAKRAALPHNPAIETGVFAQMKQHFDAGYFAGLESSDGPAPIFIVGVPRSGTSLAEQILSSHAQVHGAGERNEMTELVAKYLADRTRPGLALDDFKAGCAVAAEMADAYLTAITPLGRGKPRFTDKMPLNFRWIGIIRTLFPAARIVHCTRPPIENCMSIYASLFGSEGNRFAYDLEGLAHYYAQYADLMAHWQSVLGPDLLQFDLTALKQDQEGQTRRLLAFCGLDFDERCLAFESNRRSVRTLSAARVRQGLDRSRDRRTALFRSFLGPVEDILTARGIDPDTHWITSAAGG